MLAAGLTAYAQGRGGGAWTTVGGDAQRTAAVRTDPKISLASMQKPGFQFLWKRKLDSQPLTQPILLPNIIAYKGFKALAFVGSASGQRVLRRLRLEPHVLGAEADDRQRQPRRPCSSGLPAITKTTPLVPAVGGGRGGGGGGNRGAAPGGAPGAPPAGTPGAPPAGAHPAGAVGGAPPGGGQGGRGRGPQIAGGRGGGDNVFAISTGGMVHVMNPQIGTDQIPPVKFLPPNANVVGSMLVDNVLYAATTGNCGGAANGVWAVDLLSDAKP